ncbi:GDSL-type esterase/lipase family protein [Flavobacteriaceae bacterium KMM 6897]|nr:GDSL-type esterase/lipase family protein [Flavobacteriaceae bacterium KMM 6897]MEB8344625.1 GDSL-type esterase/lipase family protein [Flavobacteriaceae bacterium KMM 6898]
MKYILISTFLYLCVGHAQQSEPFQDEVLSIQKKYDGLWDASKTTIVFTGSSSIRMWNNIQDAFPEYQVINSGFGGSMSSDLLIYTNDLILKYKPKKVFIYEGDNDIVAKVQTEDIIENTRAIINRIKAYDPNTEIVLISAKPSIARWDHRNKYKRLNRGFEQLSKNDDTISYANVWEPMLYNNRVRPDIFLKDGLHMNSKGYDLWLSVIKDHVN